jgi:hypothetical protein
MSLENLPPVHKYWYDDDLDGLTREDLMKLQLMLRSKMEVVGDRYEWMQLKARAYKERPKADYPF